VGEGFENLEAKNGEVIQPAKRTGKPTPLPPGWQPDDQGRAYAEQHGLTGDNLGREVTAFQNHCADKGRLSCDWSAAWCGFVDKTRLGSVGGVRFKSRGDRARDLARQVEARERAEAEAKARGPP